LWQATGSGESAGAIADQLARYLRGAFDQPDDPELERAFEEQYGLAVDAACMLIEAGAAGPGPFIVTLTGHATARHGAVDGQAQQITLSIAGKFTPIRTDDQTSREGAEMVGAGGGPERRT
jgi:hypothetical protein